VSVSKHSFPHGPRIAEGLREICNATSNAHPLPDNDRSPWRWIHREHVLPDVTDRPADGNETDAEWSQRLKERSDAVRGLGYWVSRTAGEFVGWWGCRWNPSIAVNPMGDVIVRCTPTNAPKLRSFSENPLRARILGMAGRTTGRRTRG
jgi:hypothetical protein